MTDESGAEPAETEIWTLAEGRERALRALTAAGADAHTASLVAGTMIAAERDRAPSHGLFRLKGYVGALRSGRANGAAAPTLTRRAPGMVEVDGDRGFAQVAFDAGRDALIEAARAQGIAALALRNTHHFAALWPEVEALAEAGLVGLACTAATPMVAPHGGKRALFGTNPIAFAFPRAAAAPVALDMAAAGMARGEILLLSRAGKPAPEGVGIGPDGAPTTNPNAILAGAQLPVGGHKGSALALMVELLAGPLIGEPTSLEAGTHDVGDGGPPYGGELILALNPALFGGAEGGGEGGGAAAEALLSTLEAEPGVRLPGARRHAARARTPEQGFPLPAALAAEIRALAGEGETAPD